MKLLICNFKENKTVNEIIKYEHELRKIPKSIMTIIPCPSYPFLPFFRNDNYKLGAQDVSQFQEGPYTGEVSAKQLSSLNVKYVLVGHCERKAYFQEDEKIIISKIKNALKSGIKPIYIIGETKEEHDRKKTFMVLEKQIGRVLNEFRREELKNIIIAYEPVWAVESNELINIEETIEIVDFIKNIINNYYEIQPNVILGGSINKELIDKFYNKVDGFIISKNILDIDNLKDIIQSTID